MNGSSMPYDLTCEYQAHPLGVDHGRPVFDYTPACRQAAVRLVIEEESGAPAWDSGVRRTAATQIVPDACLRERTAYRWFVETEDESGGRTQSERSRFETGIFGRRFAAAFIGGGELYRRAFTVEAPVRKARAYFTALGYGELYINGRRASEDRLFPSYTNYDRRIEYAAYDVAALLRPGANAAGVWAAPHWPPGPDGRPEPMLGRYYGGEPIVFLQLEIFLADGSMITVASDGAFRAAPSPVTEVSIYHGEAYDARREQPGWAAPGFDDRAWAPCRPLPGMTDRLCVAVIPPIRVAETLPPVEITATEGGCVADFGRNLSGVLSVRADGREGDCLRLRHAELLREDGGLNADTLRSARAEDRYIWARDGEAAYSPRFTYHGFRYAEISGIPAGRIRDIRALRLHTAVRRTGAFSCSDDLLNGIHDAMENSVLSNLFSIPTDCCQRDERQGWLGDAMAAAPGAVFFADMQAVYRKWLDDIANTARPDGNIPTVAAPGVGGESFTWKAAYHSVLRLMAEVYGDRAAVRRHYPIFTAFLRYLETIESPEGLLTGEDFGDWLSLEAVPPALVRDAFYVDAYRAAVLFADIAGESGDKQRYESKLRRLREAYHRLYYSRGGVRTGFYGANNETGVLPGVLARLFGIVPEADRADVDARIRHELACARGTPQLPTGIIGTTFVFLYLLEQGEDALAYELMTRTEYPSFGFMIGKGATALWERWQWRTGYEMNSHNHSPLAGAACFFYRVLGGIRSWSLAGSGRPCVRLRPYVPPDLTRMDCRYRSRWGEIAVSWRQESEGTRLRICLPPQVDAKLWDNGGYRAIRGPEWHGRLNAEKTGEADHVET